MAVERATSPTISALSIKCEELADLEA